MDSHTIQQSSGLRTHFNAAAAISIYLCSLVSLWHRQRQKKMIKIHAFAGSVINPLFTSSFFSFCCCWRWRAWKEFTHVQTSCNIHCGDVHKKLRAKKIMCFNINATAFAFSKIRVACMSATIATAYVAFHFVLFPQHSHILYDTGIERICARSSTHCLIAI